MNFSAIYNFGGLRILTTESSQVYLELGTTTGKMGHVSYSVPSDQFSELRVFLGRALSPSEYKNQEQPFFEAEGFALSLCYEEGSRWPNLDYGLKVAIGGETLKFGRMAAAEVLKAIETCCHLWAMGRALSASMPIRTTQKGGVR